MTCIIKGCEKENKLSYIVCEEHYHNYFEHLEVENQRLRERLDRIDEMQDKNGITIIVNR